MAGQSGGPPRIERRNGRYLFSQYGETNPSQKHGLRCEELNLAAQSRIRLVHSAGIRPVFAFREEAAPTAKAVRENSRRFIIRSPLSIR